MGQEYELAPESLAKEYYNIIIARSTSSLTNIAL